MGETRVDLLHLLEDLRDAYPGSPEETILTEIVANSLDSGATEIAMRADPTSGTLTVTDNGSGMSRAALSRYHDLAATTKRRGRTIGFAGVGIKLGLLISDDVVTETRRARTHLATSWRLASKSRAPWRWIEPQGLQAVPGTTVKLYLTNPLSELVDHAFIEAALIRHFQPLLDPDFDELLRAHYSNGMRFIVNGRAIARVARSPDRVSIEVKIGRQRKPSGCGYLIRHDDLAEEERGIALSTLGKVIKRGWDWIGLTPADADHVSGLIEVPALVEVLTLNKADFVRAGQKGATFLAYRKALQHAVAAQLQAWGDAPRADANRPRRTRALERDLQSVLSGLTDDYPILATLVDRKRGGQHKLPFAGEGDSVASGPPAEPVSGSTKSDALLPASAPVDREPAEPAAEPTVATVDAAGARGPKQPARLGLTVRFESRPDDPQLGALRDSTLWVNDAHPAYRRAAASRSEGYHIALTLAMTLSRLAVEPSDAHDFITTLLAAWGGVGPNAGR